MKIKKLTLVKYDYDKFPEEWKKENPNPFKDMTFMYIGEIENMKGHAYLQCMKTGKPIILHIENIIPLTDDEL